MGDTFRVLDNPDTSLLEKAFPNSGRINAAGTAPFGTALTNVQAPTMEPDDYLPRPGEATYRGSHPRTGYGTPADLVYKETYAGHSNLDRQFSMPSAAKSKIKIEAPIPVPDLHLEQFGSPSLPPKEEPSVNRVRQILPDNIPSHKEEEKMMHEHHHHHEPVLPPVEPTKPWIPTEDDIVKVHGYNETNVKILGKISENIAVCAGILAKINDNKSSLNVQDVLHLMGYLDNTTLRATLGKAVNEILTKNQNLSIKVTSYLQGTAELEPQPESSSDSEDESDPLDHAEE